MWYRKSTPAEDQLQVEEPGAVPNPPGMAPPAKTPAAEALPDPVVPEMPTEQALQLPPPVEPAAPHLDPWKMSLLLAGSAFCGGIAVVLWNRRLLTKIREVAPVTRSPQQGRLWEDDL